MRSFTVRQTAALVLLFVLTSSTLIFLDQQHALTEVRGSGAALLRPFVAAGGAVERQLAALRGRSDGDLARQLQQVTAERDQLLAENARLRQLAAEVDQLRQQLGFQREHPDLRLLSANVVGRDPQGVQQFIVIDRGSRDGVQVGMPVVSPNFLVGQVTRVEPDRARVTLTLDGSYEVGAMLERTGAEGVLYGRWQSGGRMELRHLGADTDVKVGDVVVTSGRTERVPAGLVIGKVYKVERSAQAAAATVEVAPLASPDSLRAVTVILSDGKQG